MSQKMPTPTTRTRIRTLMRAPRIGATARHGDEKNVSPADGAADHRKDEWDERPVTPRPTIRGSFPDLRPALGVAFRPWPPAPNRRGRARGGTGVTTPECA